jgi:hypothetical protein
MASLAGTLGLLLATPLIASTIPVVRMLYVEDVLGDENAKRGEEPLRAATTTRARPLRKRS